MKNKRILKFLFCFFIICILVVPQHVYAAELTASHFFGAGSDVKAKVQMAPLLHIQSLIMLTGAVSAVVVSLIYGIQWVMATSQRRQELKASMWPLIIGVALLAIGPKLAITIYEALSDGMDGESSVGAVRAIGGNVINVVQTVGYIVAVVMVIFVGIQWVMATPAKRQELKARMWNLVVGAVLIAGSVSILGLVANIATETTTTSVSGGGGGINNRYNAIK